MRSFPRRVALLALLAVACGDPTTGSVELALTGQSTAGHTYRLRQAELVVADDLEVPVLTLRTEDDPTRTALHARLPAATYRLTLATGWHLERVRADGSTAEVTGALTSANPQAFTIVGGERSRVTLRFRVEGAELPLGDGDLDVDIEIDDLDAAPSDASDQPPHADATIDAGPGTPPDAIHVAPTGDDGGDGSADAPLRTIQAAITRAAACALPCSVQVAAGTYLEALTLASGVALVGGWRADFRERDPAVHAVVVRAAAGRTVIADGLDAITTIDGIDIEGADAGPGASSVGLWVRNSGGRLRLRDVDIRAGRGGSAASAASGTAVACSAPGGAGGAGFECGAETGGLGSAGGDPAAGGQPGAGGVSYCTNACPAAGNGGVSDGASGSAGAGGIAGAAGTGAGTGAWVDGAWVGGTGGDGGRGRHGTGGGGGGAGGSKQFRACFGCATLPGGRGGDGAPGGCGGGGGLGGAAGGGSFGVVVVASTVRVDGGVSVVAGDGGDGGRGGNGHPGALGGSDGSVGRGGPPSQQCGFVSYSAGGGGAGGHGGHGGSGGGGAGGAGGPSIAVALIDSGHVIAPPGTLTLATGTAGAGGAGGTGMTAAPAGPTGVAGTLVEF
jgi:hypothetical protein